MEAKKGVIPPSTTTLEKSTPNHGHVISEVLEVDSFELIKGREGDSSGNTLRYCLDGSVG